MGCRCARLPRGSAVIGTWFAIGWIVFGSKGWPACRTVPAQVEPGPFPPAVELYLVRLACELPAASGRSLSQWDCGELAAQLVREHLVAAISGETVRRWLSSHRLKPWRSHVGLHPTAPRDAAFLAQTRAVAEVLTRPLAAQEMVLSLDEMTSLQPRPRRVATRPAQPGRPVQVEHEYWRAGALNLFAALDTRSGRVYGRCARRKRQVEYLEFLEQLDRDIPAAITVIHLLGDNVPVHHGKLVRAWLARHPRFVTHFTPVHCSWMNPVEQWFSVLRRKRLRHPNFANLTHLATQIHQFIAAWNQTAHPFRWRPASFAKIIAKVEAALPRASASASEAA
jgi:transposase